MNSKDIITNCENALLDLFVMLRIAKNSKAEMDKDKLESLLNLSGGALETAWNDAKAKAAYMEGGAAE